MKRKKHTSRCIKVHTAKKTKQKNVRNVQWIRQTTWFLLLYYDNKNEPNKKKTARNTHSVLSPCSCVCVCVMCAMCMSNLSMEYNLQMRCDFHIFLFLSIFFACVWMWLHLCVRFIDDLLARHDELCFKHGIFFLSILIACMIFFLCILIHRNNITIFQLMSRWLNCWQRCIRTLWAMKFDKWPPSFSDGSFHRNSKNFTQP